MDSGNAPTLKPVASSHVWKWGYDEDAKTLTVQYHPSVQFPAGRIRKWAVDADTAAQVMAHDSPGTALRTFIYGKFEGVA
jgi:KTSC domain